MAGIPNVVIRIAADTAGAVSGINQVNKALGDQVSKSDKASAALKRAAAPAAVAFTAATAAVLDFTKAAAEDADSQAMLARSLKATTGATDAQVKASEEYISKLSAATGVTDDEMRPALEKLAAATGSAKKGQDQLGLAVDIAAAAHVDLAQATKAVQMADQGRLGGLNKLVPGISAATIKSKDSTKALEEASKLTAGAATDAASTYGGQMKVMATQIDEAKESIGAAFLPILEKMLPVVKKCTDLISDNTRAFSLLLAAVIAISGAILAANLALKAYQAATIIVKAATVAWTGVQWLLNVALNANPIGLIVAAIVGAAGLVFALKKAYDSSETFRRVLETLWGVIKRGIDIFLAPLKRSIDLVKDAFDAVKRVLDSPFGVAAINAVKKAVDALLQPVKDVWNVLSKIANLSLDGITNAIKDVVNWIKKIDFPDMPGWLKKIPGVGGKAVPMFLPLGVSGFGVSSARAASGSSSTLTVNVFGALDAEGTARQIRQLLDAHDRRHGRIA